MRRPGETDGVRVQISMQLWSLWPLLYQAYNEWAFDYFENILVPLDNFVSKGTAVFLSGQNPNYLNQVRSPPFLQLCTRCTD